MLSSDLAKESSVILPIITFEHAYIEPLLFINRSVLATNFSTILLPNHFISHIKLIYTIYYHLLVAGIFIIFILQLQKQYSIMEPENLNQLITSTCLYDYLETAFLHRRWHRNENQICRSLSYRHPALYLHVINYFQLHYTRKYNNFIPLFYSPFHIKYYKIH